MVSSIFSRRDFLKLAALGSIGIAARPFLSEVVYERACPIPPTVSDVLTEEQRKRLLDASRTFIAPDLQSAREMALEVDFIEGRNEDASTMCGPLAIAIMQSAGLLGTWVDRHDFWLLNPKVNLRPVEYTMPDHLYDWYEFDSPIVSNDWKSFPLMAGDMVYLHAGSGDTFEHVLVVTNVDELGRTYTVSNFFVTNGTIIEERMLYDPEDPAAGQFAAWADRSVRNKLGNTGNGGWRLWRVKDGRSLQFPTDQASVALRESLDALMVQANGEWFGEIKEIDGRLLYQFNPYEPFHPASTIKVPIALAFFHWLEGEAISDWRSYIAEHGVGGRTFAQLLEAMLVDSEELATETLTDFLEKAYLEETWIAWGLKATTVDPRHSSAVDLVACFENLYSGNWVSAESRTYLLNLLSTYTPNDDVRLGKLKPNLPANSVIYNKRGSLVDWPRVVGDSGIVQLPGQTGYSFTLHGIGKKEAGYEELEATLDQAIAIFGDYLAGTSNN